MKFNTKKHVTQSNEWAEFKTSQGTPAIQVGDIFFTKHKIPGLPYYIGYAPKVNFVKQKFNWNELESVAKEEKIAVVRFDIPNMILEKNNGLQTQKAVNELKGYCEKSPRNTFSKWNVLMDISPSEEELMKNMKSKTRYNCRLAGRKGVEVRRENNQKGLETLIDLITDTAKRQKFSIHSRKYYEDAFNQLNKHDMADILIAYYEGKPLSSWMLFNYEGTLYYPYGGSSAEDRDVMASNLLAWESIKLGKRRGCTLYDMWGATNDENNPWWGFTYFKLGYGGELVEHPDSYDFVTNSLVYHGFNLAYSTFWKIKGLLR